MKRFDCVIIFTIDIRSPRFSLSCLQPEMGNFLKNKMKHIRTRISPLGGPDRGLSVSKRVYRDVSNAESRTGNSFSEI